MNPEKYKTVKGCMRRIGIIAGYISAYEKQRGIGPGTFWLDIKAVDESIREMQEEIVKLNNRMKEIEGSK